MFYQSILSINSSSIKLGEKNFEPAGHFQLHQLLMLVVFCQSGGDATGFRQIHFGR